MALGGCALCGPGEYQPLDEYFGDRCTPCTQDTYNPEEGAASCMDCPKPECVKSVIECRPRDAILLNVSYYDPFEALNVACGDVDPNDLCDAPEHCLPGAAQCSATPLRHKLVAQPPCPHLSSSELYANATSFPCWEQSALGADGIRRPTLLYATNQSQFTVSAPSLAATCDAHAVRPRYQMFFIACKPKAVGCSDEYLDCPASADLTIEWWASFADTLAISPMENWTATSEFTASLAQGMDQRTVHSIVHVWEPHGSPASAPSYLICLSRTKMDSTPPESDSNHPPACMPPNCGDVLGMAACLRPGVQHAVWLILTSCF